MGSKFLRLIASLAVCQLAGIVSVLFHPAQTKNWYAHIAKPGFTPPDWLFTPVWLLLYLLMGIALFQVWNAEARGGLKTAALVVFGIQLALNSLWSYFFFGLRSPFYGLVVSMVLCVLILATMVLFYRIKRPASLLLAPYILWSFFATYLNYAIWRLNR
jgi:tryptophan-rich sensory protein